MSIILSNNSRPKILIANEGIIDISLIETALSNYGMTNVISTTNSTKVPEMIDKYKPDLLLLDLDMEDVDGMDILDYIKEKIEQNNMPAIITCVEKNSENSIKAQDFGVQAIISKPFKSAEAMIAIWDFLKQSINAQVS